MTDKRKGLTCAIVGTTFWGMSGVTAQYLFSKQPVEPGWLVGVRLAIAGLLLVIWSSVTNTKEVLAIWHHWQDWTLLIAFALFGMIPSQYSYFMAVKHGNAPTATILQFLGPLFIILYLAIRHWRLPRRIDAISMVIALFGTYLLVTKGQFDRLQLAPAAVFWGVMAGVGQALYTLIPIRLLQKYDAKVVTGWAMLIGSLVFMPHIVMTPLPNLNLMSWGGVLFVATFGTMFAYLLYLQSLNYILPATTGMLSSFEPFTATVLSILILHTAFGLPEMLGGAMILATAFLQAIAVSGPKPVPQK
ncbi:drug metabolite transporter (DMT) superfamily permease [Secundilactobacillus odoratitofui DSM 19909 = JCM 15043]|uniref:Drug metabolite transporter (DMT) superfamily permease n=1 Tax=Secundilactobacillus odoratitofui DSM 19909 = JCM 15043 TaxID=1423776 RepID=A0A0R1LX05_9LACO|nr:DMT family transporter [Secundilactobacillus odoratitofui]KRK97521.1 drug metabolite transporter (DMT) superfamily permease [Secundilactobacillus odoratitofui DSM 19909 = JCM 15043]